MRTRHYSVVNKVEHIFAWWNENPLGQSQI